MVNATLSSSRVDRLRHSSSLDELIATRDEEGINDDDNDDGEQ